ncbi:DUF802 domain-containing protein [Zoogloea sp.]|uniref:DUF802 domain-containing protein n=1 Tax=Zoogloea sp. TaxID=49181 RepID=UPI0035B1F4D6
MNKKISWTAFFVGLLAVAWVGVGYAGNSPLALTMTAVIGAVYLAGALELRRFARATAALAAALAAIPDPLPDLGGWLERLPASLRNPVRLRIEGERVGLPGPAMTPYLVGMLVLLGMLGTFLGMVVTLNGAVLALESTTDLHTIRAALAAPVKGLGLAFGTSVAGVAASAMLGLVSALVRRDRLRASQLLDARIATALRGFSLAHQRQETFQALQAQARALPEMVSALQAMMTQLERHGSALGERLLAGQERHHQDAARLYAELAASVDRSLKDSLVESARVAGATIQPVVEATMEGIARESGALHARLGDTVQAQLDGLAARFGDAVGTVTDTWATALARHEAGAERLGGQLEATLERYADAFDRRSATLVGSVEQTHARLQAELAATLERTARDAEARQQQLAGQVETQFDGLARRVGDSVAQLAATWHAALARQEQDATAHSARTETALAGFVERFEAGSTALLASVRDAHAGLQAELAAADTQRLATMRGALEDMATMLHTEWQQVGTQTLASQTRLCQTLQDTARAIGDEARAQSGATIAAVTGLMERAAEAPRAAAEVVGRLREELSASIARDNTQLEERSRIMDTLATLLDAINHASTEQRGAIDALVAASADLLERAGDRFEARLDGEAARLTDATTRLGGGAVEIASLGESFGFAVQQFGDTSGKLMETLQRIEGTLAGAVARSDEQLAYYVAQAREIIELSVMSQKQIVENLQQLASRQAHLAGEG